MAEQALIIFDIDGTLLQTDRVTVPAVQQTFAAHGLPVPDAATICSFFGKPVEDYEAWLASCCSPETAARIVDETNRRELELIGEAGELFPGMRDVLTQLAAQGYALAVCSNGPEPYVNEFLDVHRLRSFFREVRIRGPRHPGKTAMLADILRCIPVRPAVMVGDRADDIEAAHENGAFAIAAAYGFGAPEEHRAADARVHAAADLPQAIEALLRSSR